MRTAETNPGKSTRRPNAVVGIVLAIIAAGFSTSSAQSSSPRSATVASGQLSKSSGDAFVEGYRAFQARDYALAADRLRVASHSNPVLADYALYFLCRAEQAENDLMGAAAGLTRLIHEYPTSVTPQRANSRSPKSNLPFTSTMTPPQLRHILSRPLRTMR